MSMPSLQGQIRALFRRGMRAVEKADRHVVVDAFREHMGVPRKSFQRIEYLMRKGERQIDLIERAVGVEMVEQPVTGEFHQTVPPTRPAWIDGASNGRKP